MNKAAQAALVFVLIALLGMAGAWWLRYTNAAPTPAEYMSRLGAGARMAGSADLTFDGHHFDCGARPIVLAPRFDDYAAAFPGWLILNPERFAALPPVLKRYAFTHECGHQYVGWDEEMADCYAIRHGQRQGWLDAEGMAAICAFITPSKGDIRHPPGAHRCKAMRQCFNRTRPGKEPAL